MGRLALYCCFVLTLVCAAARAAEQVPYSAFVAENEADVYAGPGSEFYVTDRLPYRTVVEVYRRDPGGWLAIRPPENSYSWIPASKIWMTQQKGIAEVVTDDALSWIGSRVETIREHKWQVRLQRGERVEILGEKKVYNESLSATETWHQIAPPSGEFRWIQDRSVSRESGELAAAAVPPIGTGAAKTSDSQIRLAGYTEEVRPSSLSPNASAILPTAAMAPAVPLQRPAPRPRENVASLVTPDDIKAFDRQAASVAGTPRSKTDIDDSLADLEAQLSLMVSKDASLWHLDRIREQTETLIENGKTPLERGRARLLLDKVAQFEDLQRRHIQVEKRIAVGAAGAASTTPGARPRTESATAAIEPRFDGSGLLVPVHSTKRVAPPFAIVDEDGRVLQYVTPAPGLNLNRYAKKRVGIYGQKGNATSLNAPHLMAQRVVDLDRQVAR